MEASETQTLCARCQAPLSSEQCGGLCSRCVARSFLLFDDPVDLSASQAEQPLRFDGLTLIGVGGMGAVYEAYDRRLSRTVALKFLLAAHVSNPAARMRFELEALISSQLDHPGVIPVYDVGCDVEGRPFYVMRRIQGETLSDAIAQLAKKEAAHVERYSLHHLLAIFRKVCATIGFAHSLKIIHRDLKPANIMLGRFDQVFVMDWGLAKPLDNSPAFEKWIESDGGFEEMNSVDREKILRLAALRSDTNPNALLGTLGFMAPEQADGNGHQADQRTDVYALGAILYNILTLQPPVLGDRSALIIERTATGQIPHPFAARPRSWLGRTERLVHWPRGRLPALLAEIAMKALSKASRDRYASVEDLLAALPAESLP